VQPQSASRRDVVQGTNSTFPGIRFCHRLLAGSYVHCFLNLLRGTRHEYLRTSAIIFALLLSTNQRKRKCREEDELTWELSSPSDCIRCRLKVSSCMSVKRNRKKKRGRTNVSSQLRCTDVDHITKGNHLGEVPGQLLGRLRERIPLLDQLGLRRRQQSQSKSTTGHQ